MHFLPFTNPFGPPAVQARIRADSEPGWRISELVRELAGLAGLLGWLGVLFYLISVFAIGGPT